MNSSQMELGAVLQRVYALTPAAIVDAPRGFVAETYDVRATDGQRYFVKVLPHWADAAAVLRGLPVIEELLTLGIDTISRPVRTRTGALSAKLDKRALIVFAFVVGRRGRTVAYDLAQFVALLARLHQATAQIHTPVPLEAFHLPWVATFERRFAQAVQDPPRTAPQAATQRLLRSHQTQIERDWASLLDVVRACQTTAWTPVLTHGDGLGNNIIVGDDGRLYLVDWDGLLLAPAERDLWFFLDAAGPSTAAFLGCDPAGVAAVLPRYQQAFPRYQPDPLWYRYYLFTRFFDDLLGYLVNIMDHPDVEMQQFHCGELEQTCFSWLWPPLRRASAALER